MRFQPFPAATTSMTSPASGMSAMASAHPPNGARRMPAMRERAGLASGYSTVTRCPGSARAPAL